MTPEQTKPVQGSFPQAVTTCGATAELFCAHLFSLGPLFPADLTPGHDTVLGQALREPLAKGPCETVSAGVRAAWATAYATLSGVMTSEAYPTERAI
ncbi:MAG: hypothetical protein AB8B58_03880 [Roseobacter sp.]